ncbi:MAG: hypothetical protein SPK65_01870 [Succinivibrio dextrinosolvens]|nr:hypothetical protein [Succinivibrio dextrinosolvens]
MENSKYLNEERHSSVKKKLIKASLLVLIIGIVIGIALIITGIIKSNVAKNEIRSTTEIQADIDSAEAEKTALNASQSQEFSENGLSAKYYELSSKIQQKQEQIANLKTELNKAQNGGDVSAKVKSAPFYISGASIILIAGAVSLGLLLFAKKREITAYTVQGAMPIVKEGTEEITPTVSKTIGSIAKEVSRGIKEGKTEEKTNENKEENK